MPRPLVWLSLPAVRCARNPPRLSHLCHFLPWRWTAWRPGRWRRRRRRRLRCEGEREGREEGSERRLRGANGGGQRRQRRNEQARCLCSRHARARQFPHSDSPAAPVRHRAATARVVNFIAGGRLGRKGRRGWGEREGSWKKKVSIDERVVDKRWACARAGCPSIPTPMLQRVELRLRPATWRVRGLSAAVRVRRRAAARHGRRGERRSVPSFDTLFAAHDPSRALTNPASR